MQVSPETMDTQWLEPPCQKHWTEPTPHRFWCWLKLPTIQWLLCFWRHFQRILLREISSPYLIVIHQHASGRSGHKRSITGISIFVKKNIGIHKKRQPQPNITVLSNNFIDLILATYARLMISIHSCNIHKTGLHTYAMYIRQTYTWLI